MPAKATIMLDTNPHTICRLIELAREFHEQEIMMSMNGLGDYENDTGQDRPDMGNGNALLQEFHSIVDDLEPDQQEQLVALLWLGRGDFSLDEWNSILRQAHEAWNENTADYLIAHPLLADFLSEGLSLTGYSCD